MSNTKELKRSGCVYQLWTPTGTERRVYIGSTLQSPRDRLDRHKSLHKRVVAGKDRGSSATILTAFDDVEITTIEIVRYLPDDKDKALNILHEVEQQWIEHFGADCVNKNHAHGRDKTKRRATAAKAKTKYRSSEKGKEAQARYENSEKGKAARKRSQAKYSQSEKSKARFEKYSKTEKARARYRAYYKRNIDVCRARAKAQRERKRAARIAEMKLKTELSDD